MRPAEIACMVEVAFDAPPHSVFSRSGAKRARLARNVTCALLRDLLGMPVSDIGRTIGRDHSTVLSNCRTVEKLTDKDPEFARQMEMLQRAVEFRMIAANRFQTNPLEVAERIVLNPRRAAMGSSLYEIASVAAMLSDLWQAALAAEAALSALQFSSTNVVEIRPDQHAAISSYRDAFLNHMDAFRTSEGDRDNGEKSQDAG